MKVQVVPIGLQQAVPPPAMTSHFSLEQHSDSLLHACPTGLHGPASFAASR
jgi:hypothetical protein